MQEQEDRIIVKNLLFDELREQLIAKGYPKYSGQQLFNWVYKRRQENLEKMSNISLKNQLSLKKILILDSLKLLNKQKSSDGTEKFLFELSDKNRIESVLIPDKTRNTLCISSQVGCKFKCSFCISGTLGFKRNLNVSEIINQYLAVSNLIKPLPITNIVFMGIGEPLDNFTNVVTAIKIFLTSSGINLGKRRISISTCGLAKEIEELGKLELGIKLSISLHSADDKIRSQLMPINNIYNLKTLINAVKVFSENENYPITFEYSLIKGINTSHSDVLKIAKLLNGLNYKLNLIPLNKTANNYLTPDSKEISDFTKELAKKNIFYTLRKPRGQDINAACGQLIAGSDPKTVV